MNDWERTRCIRSCSATQGGRSAREGRQEAPGGLAPPRPPLRRRRLEARPHAPQTRPSRKSNGPLSRRWKDSISRPNCAKRCSVLCGRLSSAERRILYAESVHRNVERCPSVLSCRRRGAHFPQWRSGLLPSFPEATPRLVRPGGVSSERGNEGLAEHTYDVGDIQVLEGLEPVRKRPGMYIGSTGHRGLHHLVYEVVDNSVDEALAGVCTKIDVTILPDCSVRVADNGRGIPVKTMPQFGRPALEIVMTKLHAGGKFGGEGYKVSGGLHGVGVSVVNALSEWLIVEVSRDGHRFRQSYARGVPTSEVEKLGKSDGTSGTITHFRPDPQIFNDLNFDFTTLSQRLREVAFLNRSLKITLIDEREETGESRTADADDDDYTPRDDLDLTVERVFSAEALAESGTAAEAGTGAATGKKGPLPRSVVYCYDGGIVDFVKHINKHKDALHARVIHFEGQEADQTVELAMQWNAGYNDNVFSFANNINTHEGG
ncbi:MAG: hypothetical protein JW990_20825, partial [Thermoleophilia bacterium]|nr:hypothetical protein [Thermoleophilia bacterium]